MEAPPGDPERRHFTDYQPITTWHLETRERPWGEKWGVKTEMGALRRIMDGWMIEWNVGYQGSRIKDEASDVEQDDGFTDEGNWCWRWNERVLGYFASAGVDILDLYGRMPILGKLQAEDKLEWGKGGKSRASEVRNLIQTGMTVVTGGLKRRTYVL